MELSGEESPSSISNLSSAETGGSTSFFTDSMTGAKISGVIRAFASLCCKSLKLVVSARGTSIPALISMRTALSMALATHGVSVLRTALARIIVEAEATVAADPKYIPLGAPVLLSLDRAEPNGIWIAQDTGGAIKGANRVDTFWGAGDEARTLAGGMSARGVARRPDVMITSSAARARDTRLFIVPTATLQIPAASS